MSEAIHTVRLKPGFEDDSMPRGNVIANVLVTFWMTGVILFGKNFAYLRLGPAYITELTLLVLCISNFWRITHKDYFLMGAVAFYMAGGLLKGHDWFFVIKDINFLYYLLFMRFFPKDFPASYADLIVKVCLFRLAIIIASPALYGLLGWNIMAMMADKYGDGVVILFLAGYFSLNSGKMGLGIHATLALAIMSYIIDYKTAIIAIAALPFCLAASERFHGKINGKSIAAFMIAFLVVTYYRGAHELLSWIVGGLNFVLDLAGSSRTYSTGTALWRAEIWSQSVSKISSVWGILFGEFPGHNFVDSRYLGIKQYALSGGDSLGQLRSAHNIVVQIFMKSGVIGLFIYGYYFFNWGDRSNALVKILRLFAFIFALTADILEVPSRGPLLFCLMAILDQMYSRWRSKGGDSTDRDPSYHLVKWKR